MLLSILLAIYLPAIFFGLYVYNAFKPDVVFSLSKSILFGVSLVDNDEDVSIYQVAIGCLVISFFWENE